MPVRYPKDRDELKRPFATDWDRDAAIAALQARVGAVQDRDPASIEDRLYTVEILLLDTVQKMGLFLQASPTVPSKVVR